MIYNYKNYTRPIVIDFASNTATGKYICTNLIYTYKIIKKKIFV